MVRESWYRFVKTKTNGACSSVKRCAYVIIWNKDALESRGIDKFFFSAVFHRAPSTSCFYHFIFRHIHRHGRVLFGTWKKGFRQLCVGKDWNEKICFQFLYALFFMRKNVASKILSASPLPLLECIPEYPIVLEKYHILPLSKPILAGLAAEESSLLNGFLRLSHPSCIDKKL